MKTLDRIKADPRVREVSDERGMGDGIWIYLKDGFVNSSTECSMVHESTPTAALRVLKKETEARK